MLAIVEQAYRGALEKQFFDCFCLAAELHRQLGGLDMLLRGAAATYAVPAPEPVSLILGGRELATFSVPRTNLGTLLDAGAGVFVEREGLAEHGLTDVEPIDGITVVEGQELARRWPDYRTVCFL